MTNHKRASETTFCENKPPPCPCMELIENTERDFWVTDAQALTLFTWSIHRPWSKTTWCENNNQLDLLNSSVGLCTQYIWSNSLPDLR